MRRAGCIAALALACVLAPAKACAQAMDELRWVVEDRDAVLQIRFNTRVQFLRYAPLDAADLVEIDFLLLGGDDTLVRPFEESLSLPAKDPAPAATVVYPVQTGLSLKRLIVRLGRKVEFHVRPGAAERHAASRPG